MAHTEVCNLLTAELNADRIDYQRKDYSMLECLQVMTLLQATRNYQLLRGFCDVMMTRRHLGLQ